MRLKTLALGILTTVLSFSSIATERAEKGIELFNDGALLIDVRTMQEYYEGTIQGAVNIPLNTIPDNLDKFPKDKQIVVFCRSGNRSGQATTFLENLGYTNIHNAGGREEIIQTFKEIQSR